MFNSPIRSLFNYKKMKDKNLVVNEIELCRFSETIEVKNDNFIFEIYREGETILLINKETVGVIWHDNGPSSVHYYRLNGINLDLKTRKRLEEFECLVQDKLPEDYSLLSLFNVYKPLLKSGVYRVFYSPPHSFEVMNNFHNTRKLKPFGLYLPESKDNPRPSLYLDEGIFMSTQSIETIDEDRVKYYEEQILNGKQPTIVSLGIQPKDESTDDVYSQFKESYPQFILDGHHKSIAYNNINKERRIKKFPFEVLVPGVFHIVRIPDKEIDKELLDDKRKEFLSKMLSNTEISELIKFYDNW